MTAPSLPAARSIIIDTDIFSDCDDVGALAVANVLHNCGLADLRGVMVNTHSKYGGMAVDAVNTYFGNGDIPIGVLQPLTNESFLDTWTWSLGEFASKLAHNFPLTSSSTSPSSPPIDATTLYLHLLTTSPSSSLTLISIGHLTNLSPLLSHPSAPALISSRVRKLVIMGGRYPSGWEWNFAGPSVDVSPGINSSSPIRAATAKVLRDWPRDVPVTFVGVELAEEIRTGGGGWEDEEGPVCAAYEYYAGRAGRRDTARPSWDPVAVAYGVFGRDAGGRDGGEEKRKWWEWAGEGGWNEFDEETGENEWHWEAEDEVEDAKNDLKKRASENEALEARPIQRWLKMRDGASKDEVARWLDVLIKHDPRSSRCPL